MSLLAQDGMAVDFLAAMLVSMLAGGVLWGLTHRFGARARRRLHSGGAAVDRLCRRGHGAVDAGDSRPVVYRCLFRSAVGLTTTGATVLSGLDHLPINQFLAPFFNWIGGMGIIVLAVAVLPLLGIGGMQLYKAETPGPIKDAKADAAHYRTAKPG